MQHQIKGFCSPMFWCLDPFDSAGPYDIACNIGTSRNNNSKLISRRIWSVCGDNQQRSGQWSGLSLLRDKLISLFGFNAKCSTVEDNTAGYTLVQSQVLFRHGARTPISTLPGVAESQYDKRTFQAVLSHTDFDYQVVHLTGSPAVGFDKSPVNKKYEKQILEGGMLIGQLTTVGMSQCYDLGLNLRRRYTLKYKLIDDEYDEKQVYLRSTHIQRTLESLQGVVSGIFGVQQLRILKHRPKFHIEYYTEEDLYPNIGSCQCLKEISRHGMRHANNPSRNALIEKLTQVIKFKDFGPLDFVFARDDLVARDAHGFALPAGVEYLLDDVNKQASIDIVQCALGVPKDLASGLMLSVGRFHHMLLSKMDCAIKGSANHKLSLYSSHDSMVVPLLLTLRCYDWVWPPYASYMAYELWKHDKTSKHYVKVLYNNQELKIVDRDDVMIPYDEFKMSLEPFTVAPDEFRFLCENSRASIEPPRIEYSLHYEDSKLDIGEEDTEAKAGDTPAGM